MSGSLTVKAFAGVDLANKVSENLALAQEMYNLRVDSDNHMRKRPGTIKIYESTSNIDGMWAGYIGGEYYFLFASGGKLYTLDTDTSECEMIGSIGNGKCCMFEFDKKIYILNGSKYSCFDGEEVLEVNGYIPLIATGCSPSGGGTAFENVNLLTAYRRQRFSADGTATYQLAEKNIAAVTKVTVGDSVAIHYTANAANGTVTFSSGYIPEAGINNVEITYRMASSQRSRITSSTHAMLFGGNVDCRVFLWGNPNYPNYRYYSELADGLPSAEYFPVNNYTVVGNSEITDIISQYDRQLIFTKDRAFYSVCELRQDTLGNYYSSFPVYNLNSSKGSLISGAGCIVNNEPITLCEDGLNKWVSTLVENEKNAVCFSQPIASIMWSVVRHGAEGRVKLYNFQPESELYFVYAGRIYVYNYALKVWYIYTGVSPEEFVTSKAQLFFSSGGGIYKFDKDVTSDCGNPIHSFWRSPLCSFGEPTQRKDIESVSLSVDCNSRANFKIGIYDSVRYVPVYAEGSISDYGIYSYTLRGRRKRITYAGVCFDSDDATSDFKICSLSVTTKTKGENSKVGLQ